MKYLLDCIIKLKIKLFLCILLKLLGHKYKFLKALIFENYTLPLLPPKERTKMHLRSRILPTNLAHLKYGVN